MVKNILTKSLAIGAGVLIPAVASADVGGVIVATGNPNLSKVAMLLSQAYQILNDIVLPGILVLALIFFMWGVAMFILGAGDEEKRDQGKGIMTWGIVALFVIVSVWGIVYWLQSLFGVTTGGDGIVPGVKRLQ